jgi:UPF0042 nucleotide-binding protein
VSGSPEHLVIITGLSGAGKSYVQSTLEDLGFYCSDNLPMPLIEPFLEEVTAREGLTKIGIVIDIRAQGFAEQFPGVYENIIQKKYPDTRLIFLEATDEVLARRFSETRRPHPYGADVPIAEAIRNERQALLEVKSLADLTLDTSQFSVHELKAQIIKMFQLPGNEMPMLVTIISFGFKYSIPYNIDLLFDVRFLPNPHFVTELRPKTGQDVEVVDYLRRQPEYETFASKLTDFVSYLLPQYQREMKSYLTIGIGCTGGKHRSVALTEHLGSALEEAGYKVEVIHRDCLR